jgi:hypothetical protein
MQKNHKIPGKIYTAITAATPHLRVSSLWVNPLKNTSVLIVASQWLQ